MGDLGCGRGVECGQDTTVTDAATDRLTLFVQAM
jgi:hypothetical protein